MVHAPFLRFRRLLRRAAAAAVALLVPVAGIAAPAGVQSLAHGVYVRAETAVPPAGTEGTPVGLPDIWSDRHPGATGSAWYLLD